MRRTTRDVHEPVQLTRRAFRCVDRSGHTFIGRNVCRQWLHRQSLSDERRDVARRFINLVDTFYDRGVKLVLSAVGEPAELYRAAEGEESLAFRRTVSRLIEMRSEAYLAAPRGGVAAAG